jgi:predicted nucleotidyltransferase component of viral defense system
MLHDLEEMIAKKIRETQQRNENRDLSVTYMYLDII